MSKNIQIIDVSIEDVPTAKGGYKAMSVAFKDLETGKVDAKKLMSFATDKGVWATLEKSTKGDTFSVELQKDEKGYWQWIAIHRQDAAPTKAVTAPTKPTYETPDERAQRQILIVRQSSVASAVELLKDHGKQPNPEEVIKVAKQFEAYVFGTGMADLTDDIPE